ncbi:MAG: hypothetical protein J6X33_07980 [Clostridiales bacterium]|nr:hypothetical protein [Clostridiales bacterium]
MKNLNIRGSISILLISAILLAGCNAQEPEPKTEPEETTTATVQTTATQETSEAPTPTPTPRVDHGGHQAIKEYEALKDCKEGVTGIVVMPSGNIAVATTDNYINGEYKSNKKGYITIRIIDSAEDKQIAKYNTKSSNTVLIGATSDGRLIVNDYIEGTVTLYSEDLNEQNEIGNTGGNCIYDQENDRLVFIKGCALCTMSLDGTVETLVKKMYTSTLRNYNSLNGLCVIEDSDDLTDLGDQISLLSITDNSTVQVKEDDSYVDTGFCGDDMFMFYPYNEEGAIDVRDGEDGKSLRSYKVPHDSIVFSSDHTDMGIIASPANQTYSYFARHILLSDLKTGKYCDTGIKLNDLFAMKCVFDDNSEHYFILDTVKQKATKTRLIEICPEAFDLDQQFEDTVIPAGETPKPGQEAGDQFYGQKMRCKNLSGKYGVNILMGNDIKDREISYSYNLISLEDSGKDIEEQQRLTAYAIDNIEVDLGFYSKEFFETFKDYRGKGGICIVLVDELRNENGNFVANGEFIPRGITSYIVIDINCMESITLHHELWHAVENNILIQDPDAFDQKKWDELNPPKFKYANNFEDYGNGDVYKYTMDTFYDGTTPDAYFGRIYGTVNPKEDRATIVETFMGYGGSYDSDRYSSALEALQQYPHIMAKIEYMADACERVFGFRYW